MGNLNYSKAVRFTKSLAETGENGCLLIIGINFPQVGSFNVLAKIWSTVRKRIREENSIDVVGLFNQATENTNVCMFYPNNYKATSLDQINELHQLFYETFEIQMNIFKQTIVDFLDDPDNGYKEYFTIATENPSEKALEDIIEEFLRSKNLRTEKDDKKKEKFERKREKEAEKAKKTASKMPTKH